MNRQETRRKEENRKFSLDSLKNRYPKGTEIWSVLRGVSSTGMTRYFDLYVIQDNEPQWISRHAANVLGWTFDEKRECVVVKGTGMDMGFHLVYSLASAVHGDGYAYKHRRL